MALSTSLTKIDFSVIQTQDTSTFSGINATGIITANSFSGDGSQLTGISRIFTIGTRVGSAVTFNITGSSFNVSGRSGNISISV